MKTLKKFIDKTRLSSGLRELRRDLVFGARVARAIRDTEAYYRIYASVIRAESNCIDIGAHHGEHLERFLHLAPQGKHLAVEPIPKLAQNLMVRFPQTEVVQAACSDQAGNTTFCIARDYEAWSGLKEREYPGATVVDKIPVRLMPLDDLVGERRVDLVKIDVEGAELQVLRGMRRILKQHCPLILLEHDVNGFRFYDTRSIQVWRLLCDDHAYRIFDLQGNGPIDSAEFTDMAENDRKINFIAHT